MQRSQFPHFTNPLPYHNWSTQNTPPRGLPKSVKDGPRDLNRTDRIIGTARVLI